MKRVLLSLAAVTLAACSFHAAPDSNPTPAEIAAASNTTTASPSTPQQQMSAHGLAGWVGQEFAGRTTANGEIFDPMLMTASHRTLPFGTQLDVHNAKTGQTVRVRVNDRGPYVGDRLIDLSYAAAQQIGIAESGGGEIDMSVVKMGRGDREPPAAFNVTVPDTSAVAATPTPTPVPVPTMPQPAAPATVDSVQVTEQHADGSETRRQVAANGTTIEDVPVKTSPLPPTPTPRVTPQPQPRAATPRTGRYVIQVGAFSQEANAKSLQKKLASIGQDATIDHTSLYLVRIGPFETRDQAASVRAKLEAAGISAIITSQ
ncbi:MAG TPA: septal ring lytic transglycosylase RlpA family protein [Thermoanaerobaculia bacterium]|jgi:rare lipoprotein A|nr:septal ring lytic transglycosylase RlpA family protein [Thermoanaerobaculia bacterium]